MMTNLVQGRKEGESIVFILDGVPVAEIMVAHIRGNRVTLHCKAEPHVQIKRGELLEEPCEAK